MEYFIVVILCASIAAYIAQTKNRSPFVWFCLGMLLGPLSLVVAFFPKYDAMNHRKNDIERYAKEGKSSSSIARLLALKQDEVITACQQLLYEQKITPDQYLKVVPKEFALKKCPYCAEYVRPEAVVCKHCHRDLPQ